MTVDLASYNEGVRAGRRDRQASRAELLELARQWAADADAVDADIDRTEDVDVALEFSGKVDALRSCADQLTRLLRVEDATDAS